MAVPSREVGARYCAPVLTMHEVLWPGGVCALGQEGGCCHEDKKDIVVVYCCLVVVLTKEELTKMLEDKKVLNLN